MATKILSLFTGRSGPHLSPWSDDVRKQERMIDLNETMDATTSQIKPRQRTAALLAGAVGIVGALLIALGLHNLGWSVEATSQSTPSVATEGSSEPSEVSATATSTDISATSETVAADLSGIVLTDVSQVADEVVDSVVRVESISRFRGRELVVGTGSGVIVDDQGTIVTNAHVVETADSIVVVLADGSEYPGTILEVDAQNDLAAIDIEATGLQPVELGSTADLAVGDGVIAVGYPLGLEGSPSVSTGIVSALDRTLEESGVSLTNVIQTDAAITEGSSGGALFDSSGRLIGITTAVGVSNVGIEGIGFAIPVESITDRLSTLDGI